MAFVIPDTAPLRGSQLPIIWVLGGPGSGKGTQCDKIVEKYGFTHISTGDLLRAETASCSERSKSLEAIMKEGKLVPLEVVLSLLAEKMISELSTSKGFLIDGYPREKEQGVQFEEKIGPCTVVMYFEASDTTLIKRLVSRGETSGRTDDNEETIKKRLETFHQHNDPIIQAYKCKVVQINAEDSVDNIFAQVTKGIDQALCKAKGVAMV